MLIHAHRFTRIFKLIINFNIASQLTLSFFINNTQMYIRDTLEPESNN